MYLHYSELGRVSEIPGDETTAALGGVTVPAAEIPAMTWGGMSAVRQEMEGMAEAWTQKNM